MNQIELLHIHNINYKFIFVSIYTLYIIIKNRDYVTYNVFHKY